MGVKIHHVIVWDDPGARHQEPRAKQPVDCMCGRHDVANCIGDRDMRSVRAFIAARHGSRPRHIPQARLALSGIRLRNQAIYRNIDEVWIATGGAPILKTDSQNLGQ